MSCVGAGVGHVRVLRPPSWQVRGPREEKLVAQGHWELDPRPRALEMRVRTVCHRAGANHPVWTQGPSFISAAQRTVEYQPPTGLRNTAQSNWNRPLMILSCILTSSGAVNTC